jgi:RHS repeat-associated protein
MDFQFSFGLGTADNGNVSRITNRRNPSRSITYLYDELNRIHDAVTDATSGQFCWGQLFGTQSGSTFTSGYDPWGNFKTITADPNRPGCSVSTMARTINVYNKIVDTNYVYDADGNLTADPSLTYTYNNENQLTATAGTTYLYDGDGKRVEKATTGPPLTPTKLYWYGTGPDALDETDASGNTNNSSFNEYVFFGGKRVARRDFSNNVFYYFTDHLGTSREIVQAGQTTPCYDADYYPFGGEAVVATNTCTQNYKFTAKERDSESGLDTFGARYYSASMARFTSVDPKPGSAHLAEPQSWNKYTYTRNNPLKYIDPDGMDIKLAAGQTGEIANRLVKLIVTDYKKASFRAKFNQLRDSPVHTTVANAHIDQGDRDPMNPNPGNAELTAVVGANGKVDKNKSTIDIHVDLNLMDSKGLNDPSIQGQIVRHEFDHASREEADPQSFYDAKQKGDQAFLIRDEKQAQDFTDPGKEPDSMTPELADQAVRSALGIDQDGNPLPSPPPPQKPPESNQ